MGGQFVGELGMTSRAWYNYGSMVVGSIVFNAVPLARVECLEL